MPTIFIKERKILDDTTIEEFLFKSYYGGRCEAFAIGEFQNVNYYDVNSLYPTMMLNQYPLPQSIQIGKNTEFEIINYMGISECVIECPLNMNIPILPLRNDDGKIFYPTGILKGVWTHAILSYAIENGYKIKEITKQYIYTECMPLFKDYVETLYNLRIEYKFKKSSEEQTIKLLLNSLYGKFGQKPSDVYEIINNDITNNDMTKYLNKGYDMQITDDKKFMIVTKKGTKYPKNSFPIIASYVTSYAQIFMHKLLKENKPLYMDTDSIMTQEKLNPNIISNSELGKLKLEKLGVVELVAPKCYAFNHKPTMKGLNLNHFKENERYEIFKKYVIGEKIEQTNFTKLKSSLKSIKGYSVNQIVKSYKQKKMTVSDKRMYTDLYSIPIEVKNEY
jgi:hypothetical protein